MSGLACVAGEGLVSCIRGLPTVLGRHGRHGPGIGWYSGEGVILRHCDTHDTYDTPFQNTPWLDEPAMVFGVRSTRQVNW